MQASVQTDRSPSIALLRWYDSHARALPWRSPPGMPPPDAYRVWLSEVMLQQTTVAAVKAYFARFVERWPTVMALAAADEADVMAAWAGLGYYSRARNLIACAREVARLGTFPDTEAGLRALPGLGAYTAAAVAAIAFDRPAVVVDANVERVVARLFAINEPLPASRPAIRAAAATITPDERPGDFAQAMMDLGATICTPRNPRCLLCPLRGPCQAEAAGLAETLPAKLAKKAKPHRKGHAWWIERDGMVWLVRALEADETRRKRDDAEELHIQRLMPADALRIRGRHNASNALAALALCAAAGCALAPILFGLREYRGEPHRVEPIGIVNGVEFFDDSKGTNVGATVAALQGLGVERKIVVILGGDGKGQDFTPLASPVSRYARAVVLIGRDAALIRAALADTGIALADADSMDAAVQQANRMAHAGDAVLMSPACASFDMFDHYAHRAQVFCDAVNTLALAAGVDLEQAS